VVASCPWLCCWAFERAGWDKEEAIKLIKEGSGYVLSIPVHKGKPIKQGLLRDQIKKAGLTVEGFMKLYN